MSDRCERCGSTEGHTIALCGICRLEMSGPSKRDLDIRNELIGEMENALKMVLDETNAGLWDCLPIKKAKDILAKIQNLKQQNKLSIRIGEH